MQSTYSSCKKI